MLASTSKALHLILHVWFFLHRTQNASDTAIFAVLGPHLLLRSHECKFITCMHLFLLHCFSSTKVCMNQPTKVPLVDVRFEAQQIQVHKCLFPYLQTRKSLQLVPGNLKSHASFLSPRVKIMDEVILAGPATPSEKLIEVPIGTIDDTSTVVVTVGVDNAHFNKNGVDADPHIRISDGVTFYEVWIVDISNYHNHAPCYLTKHNKRKTVPSGTKVPSTFKFTFHLSQQFGYCETAQVGGYINTFKSSKRLDLSKPLSLQIVADDEANEMYPFHYISVEIF